MRKLVLILIAFIAVVTFIRAFDNSAGIKSTGINSTVIYSGEIHSNGIYSEASLRVPDR